MRRPGSQARARAWARAAALCSLLPARCPPCGVAARAPRFVDQRISLSFRERQITGRGRRLKLEGADHRISGGAALTMCWKGVRPRLARGPATRAQHVSVPRRVFSPFAFGLVARGVRRSLTELARRLASCGLALTSRESCDAKVTVAWPSREVATVARS